MEKSKTKSNLFIQTISRLLMNIDTSTESGLEILKILGDIAVKYKEAHQETIEG